MLATISIRAKIISVVAFLLVAMAGMGLLAVMKMRSMNANTTDITTNWMPSVRVLGELRASVITYRNVVRQHMLSETLDEKLANEKTGVTVIEALAKIRSRYEAMITSPEERALYNQWSKLWDDDGALAQGGRQGPARSAGAEYQDRQQDRSCVG